MSLSPEQWEELKAQETDQPPKEEKGVLGTIADVGKGILSGPFKEAENTVQAFHDTADYIDNKLGSGTAVDDNKDYDFVPDIVKPETGWGETAQSLSAFVSGWITGGKAISLGAKGMKGLTSMQKLAVAAPKAAKYVGTAAKGGVIDFLSGDASDQRLADTIVNNDLFGSSLAQYLASKDDDTAFEARLKNVVEGFVLGGAVDGAMAVFKGMKQGARLSEKTGNIDKVLALRKTNAETAEKATITKVDELKASMGEDWASLPGERTSAAATAAAKQAIRDKIKPFNDIHYSPNAFKIVEEMQESLGMAIETGTSNKQIGDNALKYIADNNLDKIFDKSKLISTEGLSATDMRTATATRAIWLNAFAPEHLQKSLQLVTEGVEGATAKARTTVSDIFDVLFDLKKTNLEAGQIGQINDIVREMGNNTKSTAKMTGKTTAKAINEGEQLSLAKAVLTDKTDDEILEIAQTLYRTAENGDVKGMFKVIATAAGKNNKDVVKLLGIPVDKMTDNIYKYRYIAMLSSFKTHMRNFAGNTAKIPLIAFEEGIQGAALGWQATNGQGLGRQLVGALAGAKNGAYYLQGLRYSQRQAWETCKNAFKFNEVITRQSEYNTLRKASSSNWGRIELPLRMLSAADEYFASLTGSAKAYETAILDLKEKGILKGLDPKTAAEVKVKWIEDSMDKAFTNMVMPDGTTVKGTLALTDMVKTADEATFQQELGKFGKALSTFTNAHPAMKLLFPFVKTPVNIFKDAFWTRGIGAPFEIYQALAEGDPKQKAQAIAHLTSAVSLWTTAYYLVQNGKITGRGPDNKFQREAMQKNGWQPNCYVDNDGNSYSLDMLEPYGSMLGFLATAVEKGERGQGLSPDILFEGLIQTAKEKTFLKGLGDLMDSIDRGNMSDGKGFVSGLAVSFIPSLLRDLGQSIDPIRRQTPDFYSKALDRTIFRQNLAPKIDWLTGQEEDYSHGGGLPAFFNAWSGSTDKGSAVFYELSRLDGIQPPQDNINGIDLSPDEQAAYHRTIGTIQIGGKNLYQTLDDVINSDNYQRDIELNPDPTPYQLADNRADVLRSIIKQFKDRAKADFIRENPQLTPDLTNWNNITNA